jgi:hypothetical protein
VTSNTIRLLRPLLLAGLAGGIAEIIWIALYSQVATLSAADVSRQVVWSIAPALADSAFAPVLGIGIHLALSVLLAFAFGLLVWAPLARKFEPGLIVVACAAALVFVWAVNFFVVLPQLNPVFVSLMPYPITFFSKLLFGLAAGWSLYRFERQIRPARIALRSAETIKIR